MANTTVYRMLLLAQGDLQPWVTVNAGLTMLDTRLAAIDPFGPRNSINLDANGALTTNLSYGYLAGVIRRNATLQTVSAGTVTCTASQTNYVELNLETGAVSANTTGFTPGAFPLATVVCDSTKKTAITDSRTWVYARRNPRLSKSVAGGVDVTLTDAECQHELLEFTGALTGNIGVIVKAIEKQWTVANKTSGAFTLTVKGPTGAGITIAQGMRAIVYHDGTNVVRATADV